MGALHEGHLSLVRRAKKQNQVVVVSIFVNPLQFGPREDLSKYPRTLRRDSQLLKQLKVDYVFLPRVTDIYPDSFSTTVHIKGLSENFCGKSRPGHFDGVATVVSKLFQIIEPDQVYFGAKDYQQALVLKKMVGDLDFDMRFHILPTVREKDGLALSSRNQYLSAEQRKRAVQLSQTLFWMREQIQSGCRDLSKLRRRAKARLSPYVRRIDYLEIADAETLAILSKPAPAMVILGACFLGKTRLIDNVKIIKRAQKRALKSSK